MKAVGFEIGRLLQLDDWPYNERREKRAVLSNVLNCGCGCGCGCIVIIMVIDFADPIMQIVVAVAVIIIIFLKLHKILKNQNALKFE